MVTMSERPTTADIPIKIEGYSTNGLFDTGALVSWISYHFYSKLTIKLHIEMNNHAKVTSPNGSNLGPLRIILCSVNLGSGVFHHCFIGEKILSTQSFLGFDFVQCFSVGIDWNSSGEIYLHQNHECLTYFVTEKSRGISSIFS